MDEQPDDESVQLDGARQAARPTQLNLPGSNNDGLPWSGGTATVPGPPYPAQAFFNEPARLQEVADRTAADLRWLQAAFAQAQADDANALLIGIQADMWDPAAVVPGGDRLNGYDGLVQELAQLCRDFGRPVLLINGDLHLYETDHPPSAAFYANPFTVGDVHHVGYAVPNLTRSTVQGATNTPREWVRLTIDPHTSEICSWKNVVHEDLTPCPSSRTSHRCET